MRIVVSIGPFDLGPGFLGYVCGRIPQIRKYFTTSFLIHEVN